MTASNPAAGVESFSPDAFEAFQTYVETSKNRMIFDPSRCARYRNWLENLDTKASKILFKPQQKRLNAKKDRAIKDFYLRNNQIYYTAEKLYGSRVVVITYNTAQYIIYIYKATGYTDVYKTY